jgi:phosphoribosylanthranilate isomerase
MDAVALFVNQADGLKRVAERILTGCSFMATRRRNSANPSTGSMPAHQSIASSRPTTFAGRHVSADAILFDAFDKQLYGGTGKTFDWSLITHLYRRVSAGGSTG